jgi:hypothetical protein
MQRGDAGVQFRMVAQSDINNGLDTKKMEAQWLPEKMSAVDPGGTKPAVKRHNRLI